MLITAFDWVLLAPCLALSAVVIWLLFKRYVFGLFDPWLIGLILNQTIVLAILSYNTLRGDMRSDQLLYVLACVSALSAGMALGSSRGLIPRARLKATGILDARTVGFACVFMCAALLANNLVVYSLLGVPALREGPRNLAMFAELGSGFGLLAYINQGILLVLPALALSAIAKSRRDKLVRDSTYSIGIASLFIVAVVLVFLGGKSGILSLLFVLALGEFFLQETVHEQLMSRRPRFVLLVAVAAVITIASFVNVVQSGYEETVLRAVIRRLFETAAGPYYFYVGHSSDALHGLNLLSYHFSQISPYLGYVDETSKSLGVNLTLYSDTPFGTSGFGPNPYYIVVGQIWAGWGGVAYALALGWLIATLRYRVTVGFVAWLVINSVTITLLLDGTLFVLYLFYALVFAGPFVLAAMVVSAATAQPVLRQAKA